MDVLGVFTVMDEIGQELGLEWKVAKDCGQDEPRQEMEFLGMLFDTVNREMRIAPSKRLHYHATITDLLSHGARGLHVSRHDLQSAVGKIAFIARACRWGYTFLQTLFDCVYDNSGPSVHLPPVAMDDLSFWAELLSTESSVWDGVKRATVGHMDLGGGVFQQVGGAVIFTDASNRGYGAAWGDFELQGIWSDDQRQLHIAWLELSAILQALRSFGPRLRGEQVLVQCDNMQAVAAVTRGATRVRDGRSICKEIALLAIKHGFEVRAEHISGVENVLLSFDF